MLDDSELKAIWYVLKELLLEGEEWLRQHCSSTDITTSFSPLNKWQLMSYLRQKRSGEFKKSEGIQLRPPPQEIRALSLWCKWNFNGRKDCRFYLGIWLCGGEFVGFRFEPPEQGENHNYYHSQPCRAMIFHGESIRASLGVPERNPTWPLPADSSLELLLCLVVSIRGMDGLRAIKKRVEEDSAMRQNRELSRALQKILSLQFNGSC